jgi:phosphoribosylaminoimidazolecarboxamide formyltransferase / IMP cyclohydrolase
MGHFRKISSALVSVYHKDNLEPLIRKLHGLGVRLYATGGTQEFIEKLNIPVTPVEELTAYPSILGGRVKTLHPKIFGGILSRRTNESDVAEMMEFSIPDIDLVIVDLYPFEETVKAGADEEAIIEKIDIGGISLIRAAAKNFSDVLIIPSRDQYEYLGRILDEKNGISDPEDRQLMAACAFNISSHYDAAIFKYFNQKAGLNVFKQSIQQSRHLRYGENPHQQGIFYGDLDDLFEQLHGKEISYNNLLDIDAAVSLINEFSEPTVIILKHNNACGVASRENLIEAWTDALSGDPISAFGGIICINRQLDKETAAHISQLFFEVIISPGYDKSALELLKQKKNRIILLSKNAELPLRQFRTVLNGVIEQDKDILTERPADMKTVTKLRPDDSQLRDLEFANKIVKHTKSNTIVLVRNKQLLASGTGQTSRVDALQQAIHKAKNFSFSLEGAVMASDAFFPFPDCVEIADKAGIKAVIQPGGSVKDQESISYCDLHDMVMVTTGNRHFRH